MFEDIELQVLLDENSTQTLQKLSAALNVSPMAVSKRLHAMVKIQKKEKWVPHELTENAIANRLNISISLLAMQKKSFLWRIVTGDKKWIYFDNPKRKRSWVDPGQPSTSTPKQNIHGHKIILCIWWDMQSVVYYELLRPNESITGDRYQLQLNCLNEALLEKRPAVASNQRKVMLLHDNARSHVAKAIKETLMQLEWKIFPHPAYSPNLAPSDYYLFRCSTAWWIHTLEITGMCENGSMNGLFQKTNRSIVAKSTYCPKDGKNV